MNLGNRAWWGKHAGLGFGSLPPLPEQDTSAKGFLRSGLLLILGARGSVCRPEPSGCGVDGGGISHRASHELDTGLTGTGT